MIILPPRTLSYCFRPYRSTPSIAYWLLQPGDSTSDEEDRTKKLSKAKDMEASKEPKTTATFTVEGFDIHEENGNFILSTDIPGVKQSDLKVELKDGALCVEGERLKGSKKAKISRELALDENIIDTSKLTANVSDGILTITAPKKKEDSSEPSKISISTKRPPQDNNQTELNLEIDLPGVSAEDLEVLLSKDGEVSITGERKRGKTSKVKSAYMLNTRKVDTSKLEVFLADGVLSIRAPAREPPQPKPIAVNGELPNTSVEKSNLPDKKGEK